uniref:Nucleic acid binding n=1 Tax=Zea mays TaxID=4577 RepID=A0A804Q788_MAIZE
MDDERVSGEVREQEDDDDKVPQLSAAAMEALREFLAGQHRPKEQNEAGGGEDEVELVPEDWRLSQFWYDERTARELVEEVVRLVSPSGSGSVAGVMACIACLTLYAYLKKTDPGVPAQLLEYDERFGQYGCDFTFYDDNRPEELPAAMKHAYRVIVADPPYLSKECLEKVAKTVSFLARPEGSFLLLLIDHSVELIDLYLAIWVCNWASASPDVIGQRQRHPLAPIGGGGDGTSFHLQQPMEADDGAFGVWNDGRVDAPTPHVCAVHPGSLPGCSWRSLRVLVDKRSLEMAVEVDARWEPMGALEYYDYWRAMYSARSNSLNANGPYQTSPSDAAPVKKEPESQAWLGLGPNAVKSNLNLS